MMTLSATDGLALLAQTLTLSLLAVGGGVSVLPDLHRSLVLQQAWLSPEQFSASVALAQVAPGPNVLFVALMGGQIGVNAGWGWLAPLAGLALMVALVLPSSLLTLGATRWARRHQHHRGVRAFRLGLGPLVVGLLLASAWLLAAPMLLEPNLPAGRTAATWALVAVSIAVLWKTRIHLLWMLAAGALAGALGWV
ncbi:chromate transporter [Amphibiibacter pelophylacis]|uniref:Chromate transporter n=1 Tax=Amphibiibacter pelophylacis TaxID=1799477 RepID=A0ACC6NYE3_9BURK